MRLGEEAPWRVTVDTPSRCSRPRCEPEDGHPRGASRVQLIAAIGCLGGYRPVKLPMWRAIPPVKLSM